MTSLPQDLRFALRLIRRSPSWSTVVVLILALGIAANTVMMAAFDVWVLRPLDFEDPEALVEVNESQLRLGNLSQGVSPPTLGDWQQQQTSFSAMEAFSRRVFNFRSEFEPERLQGLRISAGLFPMLGKAPALGRGFTAAEDLPGQGARVALISHDLWHHRFGGDPDIVGRTFRLDDELHEVIGVMEAGFKFPEWAELWTPLGLDPDAGPRDARWLDVVARLRPGVDLEQATGEMKALAGRMESLHPETHTGWSANVRPLREMWVPPVIRIALAASTGSALFVLLIICANVTNLMLARAAARGREMALRSALGAGRPRLMRQNLTESLLLAVLGGVLGAPLATLGLRWMLTLAPVSPPYLFTMAFDSRALAYTLASSLVAGLACGLPPMLRSTGPGVLEGLKSGSRTGVGPRGSRLRSVLVAAELALSTALVVGALLMVKSFLLQRAHDPGYRTEGVLTLRLSLTGRNYDAPAERIAYVERVLARMAALPALASAGMVNELPAGGRQEIADLEAAGRVHRREDEIGATVHRLSGGYLETLGIRRISGRLFSDGEMRDGADVALVSRSLAQRLWPDQSAVGRRLRNRKGGEGPWLRVVGVVADVDPGDTMVTSGSTPKAQIYLPYGVAPSRSVILTIRSSSDPASLAPAVRREIRRTDESVPLSDVQTMEQALREVRWVDRYFSQLLSLYAGIALGIAALGVYGVTAESVARRTHEMAVRISLGARRSDILRLVVARAMLLSALGISIGLFLALLLTRFGASMLLAVSVTDPWIFTGVTLLLLLVTFASNYFPARRAARTDPISALHSE